MRDEVYRQPHGQIVDFAFTEEIAAVFPDMIRRSVIGYETITPVTGLIAARHLRDKGTAYDLGCSLGATTLAILSQNAATTINVIGVDNSEAMIAGARANVGDSRAKFVEADLRDVSVAGAKVVILNLVLQFIDPPDRQNIMDNIHAQMADDGILILTEKVRDDDEFQHLFKDETHLAWKRANGYSQMEVSGKRTALENVMKIDTEEIHRQRLAQAGFGKVMQWYRCLNWASFVAWPSKSK